MEPKSAKKNKKDFKVSFLIILSFIFYVLLAMVAGVFVYMSSGVGITKLGILAQLIIFTLVIGVSIYLSLTILTKKITPEDNGLLGKRMAGAFLTLGVIATIYQHRLFDIIIQLVVFPGLGYLITNNFIEEKFKTDTTIPVPHNESKL